MTGIKMYGEDLEQLMIQSNSSGTGLLMFIDDVTEDRSSQKNSEVYKMYSLPRFSQMQQSWLDGASYTLENQ